MELSRKEKRKAAPIIYAAKYGCPALTRAGEPTLFGAALLEALCYGATQALPHPEKPNLDCWTVTTVSLMKAIEIQQWAKKHTSDLDRTGLFGDAPLLLLDEPPLVNVEVSVVAQAEQNVHDLVLTDLSTQAADMLCPVVPPPKMISIRAGYRQCRLRGGQGAIIAERYKNFTFDSRTLNVQL